MRKSTVSVADLIHLYYTESLYKFRWIWPCKETKQGIKREAGEYVKAAERDGLRFVRIQEPLMAASKSYRFLCSDREPPSMASDSVFELDESDVWNAGASSSPDFRKPMASSRKKPSARRGTEVGEAASSLPVNVPDWSKILKEDYKENRRRDSDEDLDDGDSGNRIPPHEFLARQLARTRIASFSVHEGVGRTLKGRDLSRVRNAIFEKTGFQD